MKRRGDGPRNTFLPGEPLPAPDPEFDAAERACWYELVGACAVKLRRSDFLFVGHAAQVVASWRQWVAVSHTVELEPEEVRERFAALRDNYRTLAELRIPMRERRRLLFPDRPKRRELM